MQLALDLLLPSNCVVCRKPPMLLCRECEPATNIEIEKSQSLLWSALRYSAEFSKVINAYKENSRIALKSYLVKILDSVLLDISGSCDFEQIVIAQSSKKNFQKRGFNPVLHLLRNSKVAASYQIVELRLQRQTKDQTGLTRRERDQNLAGAFRSPVKLGRCLVLDDVKTTGATISAMADAVSRSGGQVVAAAVLAKSFDL